jgi:hypothetical protein
MLLEQVYTEKLQIAGKCNFNNQDESPFDVFLQNSEITNFMELTQS